MTVNGHVMGEQIGLVYVTAQWFDESALCSPTRRLAANVILHTHTALLADIGLDWCVHAILFLGRRFVNLLTRGTKTNKLSIILGI